MQISHNIYSFIDIYSFSSIKQSIAKYYPFYMHYNFIKHSRHLKK